MKKLLYIFYVPLLILEWFLTLISNTFELFSKAVEEICINLNKEINGETISPVPTDNTDGA